MDIAGGPEMDRTEPPGQPARVIAALAVAVPWLLQTLRFVVVSPVDDAVYQLVGWGVADAIGAYAIIHSAQISDQVVAFCGWVNARL